MGFPEGYTHVVGISENERQEMLGKVMDPHTLEFMFQVCKYMAPIADRFYKPGTGVPNNQNLGGMGVADETDLVSGGKFSSPPQSKRARTETVDPGERTPCGRNAES